jgi:hypothetical protein
MGGEWEAGGGGDSTALEQQYQAGPPWLTGVNPSLPPINTSATAAAGGSNGDDTAAAVMRLGVKLEQRSDVRRLVDVLARRVRQAGDDLSAAVAEVREHECQQQQGCTCQHASCLRTGACCARALTAPAPPLPLALHHQVGSLQAVNASLRDSLLSAREELSSNGLAQQLKAVSAAHAPCAVCCLLHCCNCGCNCGQHAC